MVQSSKVYFFDSFLIFQILDFSCFVKGITISASKGAE